MRAKEKANVIFNGIMWILEVRVRDEGIENIHGKPVHKTTIRRVLETEDFRGIKRALVELGLGLNHPEVRFSISSDAVPKHNLSAPETPFTGPFGCLIRLPRIAELVPDDVNFLGLIYLQHYTEESGGLFCPPVLLENIGINLRRFRRVWP